MTSLYQKKLFINKRKRVLKKTLVGISVFLFATAVYSILSLCLAIFLKIDLAAQPLFAVLLTTLTAIAAYKPLDYLYEEIFRRYLFKKRSYTHIMLMNLADELDTVLDLQEFANLVVNTFGELLHLKTVALAVADSKSEAFQIAAAFGWPVSEYRKIKINPKNSIINHIQLSGPHVLVRNRVVRTMDWQEANRVAHEFDILRAGWIIPLMVKNDLIGMLAFSSHQPERTFDETDFQFFRKFAQSVARKVKNAMQFMELKQMNEQLQDSQSRILQMTKLAAIEQLATGLAHQIHNPLTIISGKAQVLLLQKDRVPMDDRIQEVLKTIVKQTKRAADITRKLLMFSQGSGSSREAIQLDQVLNDTVALISYQTSLDGIEVTRSVDPDLPPFEGNIQEMREVFFNLILNAVQSVTFPGRVHVELAHEAKERIIELQVSDTGKGIKEEHVDKLFNPFFTTRENGLGLGLFVTKQIIHRLGGSIRVESRPGEGSLFIVRLPLSQTEPNKERIANQEHAVSHRPENLTLHPEKDSQ